MAGKNLDEVRPGDWLSWELPPFNAVKVQTVTLTENGARVSLDDARIRTVTPEAHPTVNVIPPPPKVRVWWNDQSRTWELDASDLSSSLEVFVNDVAVFYAAGPGTASAPVPIRECGD